MRVSRRCEGAETLAEGTKQDLGAGFPSIAHGNRTLASGACSLLLASEKVEIA
jgi:hypothetical protein